MAANHHGTLHEENDSEDGKLIDLSLAFVSGCKGLRHVVYT